MNVVLYTRVSTNKREQKPEVQAQELKRYCKARGFLIAHEIMDRASGGTDDRPGLKRLLQLVRSREVDAVIVVKKGIACFDHSNTWSTRFRSSTHWE